MFPALASISTPMTLPSNRFLSFGAPRKPRSLGFLSLPVVRARASSGRTRRPLNVDGEFFVDTVCIICDTCHWMAPDIFTSVDNLSAVSKQPQSKAERLNALQGVYHSGYHSEKSYGAPSYLLVHPDGNVLIDRDDIADHEKWSKRLKCDRILHAQDGSVPWNLGEGIELIHTPGHTKGSVCLFYGPLQVLFTGDHLDMTATGLSIYERYNRDSAKSLARLNFKWILPGHGRRVEYENTAEKTAAQEAFVELKLARHSGF